MKTFKIGDRVRCFSVSIDDEPVSHDGVVEQISSRGVIGVKFKNGGGIFHPNCLARLTKKKGKFLTRAQVEDALCEAQEKGLNGKEFCNLLGLV